LPFIRKKGKIDIEGAVIAVPFMHRRNFIFANLKPKKIWIIKEKLQLCLSQNWIQSFLKWCY